MAIKYCIWDVGNVIYRYSLDPLARWIEETSPVKPGKPLFDFRPYMLGKITTAEMMQQLCRQYEIDFSGLVEKRLFGLFWEGISEYHAETRRVQEILKENGIINCLLSNALPILCGSSRTSDIIRPQYVFTSYDLGLLKSDLLIYREVLRKLDATPQETAFVDGKAANVKAAETIGIQGIIFAPATIAADIKALTGIRKLQQQNVSA